MAEEKGGERALFILGQSDLARLLNLSTSSVQRLRKGAKGGNGSFPKRRDFGGGVKGWLYKDLVSWLDNAPVDEGTDEGDN